MTLKVFILEDSWHSRGETLQKGWPQNTVFQHAENVTIAVKILEQDPNWDIFLLDHDTGFLNTNCKSENHDSEFGTCPDCVQKLEDGGDLVRWICQNNIGLKATFFIHSTNVPASQNMAVTLARGSKERKILLCPFFVLTRLNQTIPQLLGLS